MFFPFKSVDDTKKENITDINENICENENDEVSPDPELLKKVVEDGIKDLFSDCLWFATNKRTFYITVEIRSERKNCLRS